MAARLPTTDPGLPAPRDTRDVLATRMALATARTRATCAAFDACVASCTALYTRLAEATEAALTEHPNAVFNLGSQAQKGL